MHSLMRSKKQGGFNMGKVSGGGAMSEHNKYSQKPSDVSRRWQKWYDLYKKGLNQNQIAKLYGVGKSTVYYAIKRSEELIKIYGKI